MRAHQVVVVNDDRRLPPTNFFRQFLDEGDEPGDDGATRAWSRSGRFESVLTAPAAAADGGAGLALPQPRRAAGDVLQRPHLRRRADHLSQACSGVDSCATSWSPRSERGQEVSVTAEVHQVIELVMEHARTPARRVPRRHRAGRPARERSTRRSAALAADPELAGLEEIFARSGRAVLREEPGAGAGDAG